VLPLDHAITGDVKYEVSLLNVVDGVIKVFIVWANVVATVRVLFTTVTVTGDAEMEGEEMEYVVVSIGSAFPRRFREK
jgi:hypothetical protein